MQYPMPTFLAYEFADSVPARAGDKKHGRHVDYRQMRYMLYAMSIGKRRKEISEDLGIPPKTISNLMSRAKSNPDVFLKCGYVRGQTFDQKWARYICLLCGKWYADAGRCIDHAADHIWPDRFRGLGNVPRAKRTRSRA